SDPREAPARERDGREALSGDPHVYRYRPAPFRNGASGTAADAGGLALGLCSTHGVEQRAHVREREPGGVVRCEPGARVPRPARVLAVRWTSAVGTLSPDLHGTKGRDSQLDPEPLNTIT